MPDLIWSIDDTPLDSMKKSDKSPSDDEKLNLDDFCFDHSSGTSTPLSEILEEANATLKQMADPKLKNLMTDCLHNMNQEQLQRLFADPEFQLAIKAMAIISQEVDSNIKELIRRVERINKMTNNPDEFKGEIKKSKEELPPDEFKGEIKKSKEELPPDSFEPQQQNEKKVYKIRIIMKNAGEFVKEIKNFTVEYTVTNVTDLKVYFDFMKIRETEKCPKELINKMKTTYVVTKIHTDINISDNQILEVIEKITNQKPEIFLSVKAVEEGKKVAFVKMTSSALLKLHDDDENAVQYKEITKKLNSVPKKK